jgi:uncharacterized protein
MARYNFTSKDIEPLLEGLAILGTGGGGNPSIGKEILENDINNGREIVLLDPRDIPDDTLVVSGGIMGSVQFLDKLKPGELISRWEKNFELIEAAKTMENYLGKKIEYVVPFEVGGLNTPVIMSLASRMGIGLIDGDALGRSAPETQMTSFLGHGISLVPMSLVDAEGNIIIATKQNSFVFADYIGRCMITKGGGLGGNIHYPMNGKQLKKSVIPNTITEALKIGKVILNARRENKDPISTFIKEFMGIKLFHGRVTDIQGEDRGGFYITKVTLNGQNNFKGLKAKIVIKNEVMALWVDGVLKSVFPDLVCMLNPLSGSAIMSTEIAINREMILIGKKCHERLRESLENAQGAEAFQGNRYGYPEIIYSPIEKLN